MSTSFRVLMIDLLVERAEFGHGGNQEVIRPMAALSDVEVLLITPQMQSFEAGSKIKSNADVQLEEIDVPNWDNEYDFWGQNEVELEGRKINFKRIIMPMHENENKMNDWLKQLDLDAVVCSGSRRNVSIWEKWMGPTETMFRAAAKSGTPTLGICFGHQLLCHSLGANIERADKLSSGIWSLELTEKGKSDILLTTHKQNNEEISGLFSHQDHVMSIPDNCTLLSRTSHNLVTAVRVNNELGVPMPAWGIQFHPEAARKRIERAYGWGHISEEEYNSFRGEHDGAGILTSFAKIVMEESS
ncbi:type 1 glutamine amidotransferase [Euryarchaeota archaeon]|nr:type 1 glutamine amidotransferase [Euryarchaeota archaeon]MDC3247278.1 type 1 glutamine amidotransferase [Euryarchaeota archaeon]